MQREKGRHESAPPQRARHLGEHQKQQQRVGDVEQQAGQVVAPRV
jgi:hypothetical protein